MRQSIDAVKCKKRRVQEEYDDSYPIHEQALATPTTGQKGKKGDTHISNYFMPRTISGAQPTIKSVMQSKEVMEKCDIAISKWMIDASVPFNAVNSTYFQPMIDAICSMGAGTIFLKFVDASDVSKTAEMIYKLFKEVILYVGAENIVHIVTDNAANYVAADRLLEAEFPKLFWSPCAAHCINLMFQDIGKLAEDALRAIVTSREWTSSAYSKDSKAKKFVDQVLDSSFWKHCGDIVRLTEPLVRVMRIVDSEYKPAMSFLYRAIYKARDKMMWRFRMNKKKIEPYLEILDRRWDLQLRKNLHAAGYSHGDLDLKSKLTSELRLFKNAEGDFGRQTAIHDRNTHIHSKKRNRLEHQKLDDLVYVRYNLRLQQRKQLRHQNYDPINIETLDDHSDLVMEESPPHLTNEEVDALRNDLASMTIQPVSNDIGMLLCLIYNHID
ncbi:hypothetical protein QQ045_030560 [Rhodiola kirilowii]